MCNNIPASQYQCKSTQNLLRLLFYFNFTLKLIFSVFCIFCGFEIGIQKLMILHLTMLSIMSNAPLFILLLLVHWKYKDLGSAVLLVCFLWIVSFGALCVLRGLWFFFWIFSKGETAFLFGPAREAPFILSLFCSSTKKLVHLCISQHQCEKVYPCGRSSCWQWWKDLNKSSVFCASD